MMMAKLRNHLIEFGKTTSVKGISKVIKSESVFLKVMWLFAVVVGASIAGYQLHAFLSKFFSFSVYTQITACNDCHPPFPDVTICNLNPLALVSNYPSKLFQFDKYIWYLYHLKNLLNIDSIIKDELNMDQQRKEAIYGTLYSQAGYFQNVDPFIALELITDSPEKLVQRCQWYDWDDQRYEGEDCTTSSQVPFFTTEYYICTTLHLNGSDISNSNNQIKGLEAVLYLNDFSDQMLFLYEQYITRSQAKGARLLIHPRGTLPDMTKGFNIAPGNEVTIHLTAKKVTKKPDPYSDCIEREWLEETNVTYDDIFNVRYKYTDQGSVAVCKQKNTLRNCNCFHPYLPVTGQMVADNTGTPGCNSLPKLDQNNLNQSKESAKKFLQGIACYLFKNESNTSKKEDECSFKQLCEEYTFTYSVSQSPWPHEAHQLAFYCNYITKGCDNIWTATSIFGDKFDVYKSIFFNAVRDNRTLAMKQLKETDLISKNFIQLKVKFSDSGVEEYTDVPAVTIEMFFGTMGGMLNLWIGITFFTMIELLDLGYTILKAYFCGKKNKVEGGSKDNLKDESMNNYPFTTNYTQDYGEDITKIDVK